MLDARRNEISGTFPVTLDSIGTLEIMFFDYNQLTGSLPEVTSALTLKQTLSLSHNQFSGNIAASLDFVLDKSNFRLQHVDVSYNLLSGPFSPLFGFLPSFRHLDLSGNSLTGPFPSSVGWDNIEFLASSNNFLTGTVPVGYPTLSKSLARQASSVCAFLGDSPLTFCLYLHFSIKPYQLTSI